MAQQLVDLPLELQIEIFSNILSVKHLGKILSINKATHDQLIQSETFWKNLINNYSKAIGVNLRSTKTDELFNSANIKNQFLELIHTKKKQFESLQMTSIRFDCMIYELEKVREEMQARNEAMLKMGGIVNSQQIESLQQEGENVKAKKLAIEEQFKKMIID